MSSQKPGDSLDCGLLHEGKSRRSSFLMEQSLFDSNCCRLRFRANRSRFDLQILSDYIRHDHDISAVPLRWSTASWKNPGLVNKHSEQDSKDDQTRWNWIAERLMHKAVDKRSITPRWNFGAYFIPARAAVKYQRWNTMWYIWKIYVVTC